MIRWCAYCQRYQGEAEPYEDYSLTHTICEACFASHVFKSEGSASLHALRHFFARLANAGAGLAPSAAEVVKEGAQLGVDPIDLLLGVVQPVLYQIGQRWARSEITIAEEHRVTALCSAFIQSLACADPGLSVLRRPKSPDVLLVVAEDNYHSLGVQILEVLLLRNRVSTHTVYPGIPAQEIVKLTTALSPKVVAMSVAMPAHLSSALSVAERLAELPAGARPLVVIGGHAIRTEELPRDAPLIACRDPRALVELTTRARSLTAGPTSLSRVGAAGGTGLAPKTSGATARATRED